MSAEPADLGYGAEPAIRFGIVYEAQYGGSGWGCCKYVVVDRVLGWRTAWRIHVDPRDSNTMTQDRGHPKGHRLRQLVAGENERWHGRSAMSRAVVTDLRRRAMR